MAAVWTWSQIATLVCGCLLAGGVAGGPFWVWLDRMQVPRRAAPPADADLATLLEAVADDLRRRDDQP